MTLTEADMAVITAAPVIADTRDLSRAEWLQLRKAGLGGSDAAAVLGLSRWTSSFNLWLDKTGQAPDDDNSSTRLRAGNHLESFVIAEAELATPGLHVDHAPYMLAHPDHPILFADIDGAASLDSRRRRGGFEAKTAETTMGHHWSDGVPAYYETQVFHYLAVTGWDWWIVGVLIGFGRLEVHVVERDDEIIEALVAAELAWWQRHIIEGEPPVVDGSRAATEALALIEARAGAVRTLDPDEFADLEELYAQLAHDKAVMADASAGEDLAKNRVRQLMGEHTELADPDGRTWATWRRSKDKTVVDYQAAAERAAFALGVPLAELLDQHTTTKPGPRTLRTAPGLSIITKEN